MNKAQFLNLLIACRLNKSADISIEARSGGQSAIVIRQNGAPNGCVSRHRDGSAALTAAFKKYSKWLHEILADWDNLIETAHDDAIREDALLFPAAEFFTHSYFAGGGSKVNPAAAYIKDARIVYSPVGRDADKGPDLFSFWVDPCLMVVVTPSDAMAAAHKAHHGGRLEALQIKKMQGDPETVRVLACMRSDNHGWSAIAGDAKLSDMIGHIIKLLSANNTGCERIGLIKKHFYK